MRGGVVTTSIVRGTPYFEAIWPLTEPLFRSYCEKWEMEFRPHIVSLDDPELTYFDTSPAPRGTGVVYAGIPHRRALLDEFKVVVFLDSDAIIMSDKYDICRLVTDNCPIAAGGNFNGAVVVMRSCDATKRFLDLVWEGRQRWRTEQWLEQGCMMELVGYDGRYPGDNQPSKWIGRTEWSPFWSNGGMDRWNASPWHPQDVRPLIMHPGGVQPFEERLRIVQDLANGILPWDWRQDVPDF